MSEIAHPEDLGASELDRLPAASTVIDVHGVTWHIQKHAYGPHHSDWGANTLSRIVDSVHLVSQRGPIRLAYLGGGTHT